MEIASQLKRTEPRRAGLERRRAELAARGVDIIDLSADEPDLPAPDPIVEAAAAALRDPARRLCRDPRGSEAFRRAVAAWYDRRFGVRLDPGTEIAALGSPKEGLAHLVSALAADGETVLLPEPASPSALAASRLAGSRVHGVPLAPAHGFLPDLDGIEKEVAYRARLLLLNYPNNPTGAVADLAFFERAAAWASQRRVWVAHDASYSETAFERPHPSFLQARGAKSIAVEFGSPSAAYRMAGWRVAWAAGSAAAIEALVRLLDVYDARPFGAVQEAAAWALEHGDTPADVHRRALGERKRLLAEGLERLGWRVFDGPATPFVWTRTPGGLASSRCAELLLEEAHVVAAPGAAFGPSGEGCLRLTAASSEDRLDESLRRLGRIPWPHQDAVRTG